MTAGRDEASGRRRQMLLTAFGAPIVSALGDPETIEIMVNPDGKLWVDRAGQGRGFSGQVLSSADAERIIRIIAAHVGRDVHADAPIVSAELPESRERFEGLLPPIVTAPCFSIRKPAGITFMLSDYVEKGIMTADQAQVLKTAVSMAKNILIAGGAASGKTTLANALLAEIATLDTRVIILEDTRELRCDAPDCVALKTKPGVATLADLVRSTLRLRPDRIIIGEVRGAEALDMLKAWNTGHPGGIATIHANSAASALSRLEQLLQEAVTVVPKALIADAIDVVVYLHGRSEARRVSEMIAVDGVDASGGYQVKAWCP